MRKLIPTLSVCLAMAASFVSCGSKDSSSSKAKKDGIEGKWILNQEAMDVIGEGSSEMDFKSGTIDFKDNNKVTIDCTVDYTKFMTLKDDKVTAEGYDFDIIDFTGTELALGMSGETVMTLTREEKSDSKYGTYDYPINKDDEEDNAKYTITFNEDGTTLLSMNNDEEYYYDEETKELKDSKEDDDPFKAEIDGDKMTITDSDGKTATLTRAD